MKLRTLVLVGILLAAAVSLSLALVRHDGVGVVEWIVGIVIVLGLVLLAAQTSRRALGRS